MIERVSGKSYHDFIWERQIDYLKLKHTGFAEDRAQFVHEALSPEAFVHQLFKQDGSYIDPTEPAASYGEDGTLIHPVCSTALRGFSDLWASAQDV